MKRSSNALGSSSSDVFAVVLALVVGIMVWFSRAIFDFVTPPQEDLSVPSLIGLTEDDAHRALQHGHLDTVVIARRANDRFPVGAIISQDPLPNARVRPGRRISVVVSTGVHLVTMPDLRYRSLREVHFEVSRLRLRLAKERLVDSDNVDAGHVVEQDPIPLTKMREGDPITLTISRGQPSAIVVSDFIGLQIDDARDVARRGKLRFGQIVWTPFGNGGPPRGVVVRQRPASGSFISPNQMVSLQVSAGPRQRGYLVREVHAALTMPLEQQSSQLRVVAVDSMGSRAIYDGYGLAGQRFDLSTTTVGPAILQTYVNNSLIDTTTIALEAPGQADQKAPSGSRSAVSASQLEQGKHSTRKEHK